MILWIDKTGKGRYNKDKFSVKLWDRNARYRR